ncbi:MAG: hypothetical protein Q8S33_28155 [Myxococcales bacterium]|nr:hypothetical protein [Myxococcales bacterium]MDP3504245.1 hypothetical protein [Myxococcales bacterium]
MPLAQGDSLGGGWVLERLARDGSLRFSRPPAVDRRRAVSRLVVMGGCLAVTLALLGASATADDLWVLTSSLIVLFGATTLVAGLAAIRDLRLAALGVFLEVDVRGGLVRGVLDGAGVLGQFSVTRVELPRSQVTFSLVAFDERPDGSGMLVATCSPGGRLLAPDLPVLEDLRPLLAGA